MGVEDGGRVNCVACGEANRDGARFCIVCGAPFVLSCPSCGAELPAKARFCDSCGAATDAPADAPKPGDAATRKTVTVVFADLTGSTSIGERMDPEAFRALMGPFYTAMRSEVETRDGVIAKFQGDGVMALFGIPDVREDDASRALDAAVAMQRAVAELPQRDAVLSLRIGINTGEVVIGEMDEDLVGDTINVAARLEGAAAPGEILVGEETWRLTRSGAAYEPVAPLALKGKTEPVPAFRLVAIGEQGAEGGASVFVGRDGEVSRLTAAFEEVLDASAARLVTIVGSPGLGKTRLAREFAGSLTDRAIVVETRCEAASSSTFAPVVDAIRSGAQIDEAADANAVLARVEEIVPATEPERERIVRLVAGLLGAGSPGSTEETFWAIRRMIEIGASTGPIVFVLDDMHWAEPVLLDLIEHLSEYIRSAPVLLVVTGRPELRDIRPSLVEGGRALAVVALEGLDQGSTTRLACELLGGDPVPEELLARLPSSTEGNPLFVRELVRMLVDDGVLQRTNGSWTVTIDVDAITVPPTIHSLLAARVDRLRAEERTILELASVIGREFYRGALAELVPPPLRATLDAHLESLRRKELVEPAGTYWIDESVFHFHHVLIRDAAYRRLLKGARADLHERVAQWLTDKTAGLAGEHDEAIGYHLEQAYLSRRQLGPLDEASVDLGRRAALLLGAEARRALDRDDHPAAAALAARALDVLDVDDGVRAEPLILRCEALLGMGDVTDGTPAVRELERIATTERLAYWATCFDAELANLTDPARLRDIEKRVAAAASALEALGDIGGSAKAHTVHAATLARLGRFAECEDELDRALTAARKRGDRGRITAVLGALPQAALWGPHPVSRAGGRCLDVVRLLRITTQSPAVEAISSRCQAVLEALRGRADAARGMLRKARRVQGELGLRHGLLETELAHGIVELVDGDASAAEEHLKVAHDGFLAMGVDASAAQAAALLGRAYLAMGEEDDAAAFADESERLGGDDVKTAIAWRAVRAVILARRGKIEEARLLAERAVELAAATDAVLDHGDAYMALSAVHRASGDHAAAKAAADRATALYDRKGATALVDREPAPSPPIAPLEAPTLQNDCTRAVDRFAAAFDLHDWDAMDALFSDDVTVEERRAGLRVDVIGRTAVIEMNKGLVDIGATKVEHSYIAIRGQRLGLRRVRFSKAGDPESFDTEVLTLEEIDTTGRLCRFVSFDAQDVDAAMDELDDRFVVGEGAPYAETLRVAIEFNRVSNARDWTGWERLMDPGHVLVDHRPASLGEIQGASTIVAATRTLIESLASSRAVAVDFDVVPGLCMSETHVTAATADGTPIEIDLFTLMVVVNGKVKRTEYFPVDQADAARKRFDELAGRPALLDNACARACARFDQLTGRGRWDDASHLNAENVTFEDRRKAMSDERHGHDEVMDVNMSVAAVGVTRTERTPVAVRGERYCIDRVRFIGKHYESEILRLGELDPEGRFAAVIAFDVDDLDAAIAEMDDRYYSGEGAAFVVDRSFRDGFLRGLHGHGWDEFRALHDPACVFVDHRPASLGELSVDSFIEATQALMALIGDLHGYWASFPARGEAASIGNLVSSGRSDDGSLVEFSLWGLNVTRGEKAIRVEIYPFDRLNDALARFEELGGRSTLSGERAGHAKQLTAAGSPPIDNAAMQTLRTIHEATNDRDWDRWASYHSPDIRLNDRRPGLADTRVGLDSNLDHMRVVDELDIVVLESTCVAVRGSRLALSRTVTGSKRRDAGFEAELLFLNELDESGRNVYAALFDRDQFLAAIAELEERFAQGEGGRYAAYLHVDRRFIEALNRRDPDAMRSMLAGDFVFTDHRVASWGEPATDDWLAGFRVLDELVDDIRCYAIRYHALRPNGALTEFVFEGRSKDGAEFGMRWLGLSLVRDGGFARLEVFPSEHFELARARFDELMGAGYYPLDHLDDAVARYDELPGTDDRSLENACTRFVDRQLMAVGRWDHSTALLADSVLWDDRRAGVAWKVEGREDYVEVMRATMPGVETHKVTVAIRGDRFALSRVDATMREGFEVSTLAVHELDESGLLRAAIVFDPDDLDAAYAELDARWLASGEADEAEHVGVAAVAAINAQDRDKMRSLLVDDFTYVDHRRASRGSLQGADAFVEQQFTMFEIVPDRRLRRVSGRANGVATFHAAGTDRQGNSVEWDYLIVTTFQGGRMTRMEVFPLDRFDEALARSKELAEANE